MLLHAQALIGSLGHKIGSAGVVSMLCDKQAKASQGQSQGQREARIVLRHSLMGRLTVHPNGVCSIAECRARCGCRCIQLTAQESCLENFKCTAACLGRVLWPPCGQTGAYISVVCSAVFAVYPMAGPA